MYGKKSMAKKRSCYKMKAAPYGNNPMKKNFPAAFKFNDELKAASAAGKLDDNPKFKAAVDKSPARMYKDSSMKDMHSPAKMYKNSPAKNEHSKKALTTSEMRKAEKKKAFDKVGADAYQYHMKQAKAEGLTMAEYKKKLKKKMRGF